LRCKKAYTYIVIEEKTIDEVLGMERTIIDVRSPAEFDKGHIPEAINIPLFSDAERAQVGTVYKQESRERAVALGYQLVTPKFQDLIQQSFQAAPEGEVIVHCWRGGMRSAAFAKHLAENGFSDIKIIIGGYKAYRNYVLEQLAKPGKLKILGGYTGSGKTPILSELKALGKQIIDLEKLANHKGSAFGGIGAGESPTVQQFENNLHREWSQLDRDRPIWLEDESHNIGPVRIPLPFYRAMRASELYFIDIPKEERARHLVREYSRCDHGELIDALDRISKRLGGRRKQKALEHLEGEDYYEVALITLQYYDKFYQKSLARRPSDLVTHIKLSSTDHRSNANHILKQ
jgi:tRNA 2-selenouridine synthase